jgi:hypothetical protein
MQAENLILEMDAAGPPKQLPGLPPNTWIEVILLVLNEDHRVKRRFPSPKIAGKGRILGNITRSWKAG